MALAASRGDQFIGILNGLDTSVWDPATDADLAAPYSRADRAGKAICRSDLLRRVGFDAGDPGPVIGMIGRLDPQKGFDLLSDAAPALLEAGVRLVVQGSGDPALAAAFRALAGAAPDRVALIERFDRAMARRIYAGVDCFAMPSRFEPCGQGQMIALRYGTPPIVNRTGGLADTVIDEDGQSRPRDRLLVRGGVGRRVARGLRTRESRCGRRAAPAGTASSIAPWPSTSTGRPDPRRAMSRRIGARSRSGRVASRGAGDERADLGGVRARSRRTWANRDP